MIDLLCRFLGLPASGIELPVTVSVARGESVDGAPETWTRNFAGRRFSSRLSADRNGQLREAFGPFLHACRCRECRRPFVADLGVARLRPALAARVHAVVRSL